MKSKQSKFCQCLIPKAHESSLRRCGKCLKPFEMIISKRPLNEISDMKNQDLYYSQCVNGK